MSEWKETTLGEICLKITDGAHHSPKEFEGGMPMFSVKNMKDQGFDYNGVKTISEEDFEKLVNSGCQPEIDDILIAKDGSVMKHVFRVKGSVDYVLLSSIAIVRPDKTKVNPAYLVYAIKEPATTDLILNNYVGGSGVPRIVLKDFKKVDLSIPELETQEKIAEVLSSLDDKIDLLHRQNQTLEQMAEALFRQWFVEEADEGWEEVTLKSLCKVITKGTTPTSLKRQFVEVGINFIKVNCIDDNGNFLYDKFNFIDDETHHVALKRSILQEGDLLYSIAGTIGRMSEVTHEVLPANVNQALAILRVNTEIINPYYVKYSLKDPNITFDLHSKIVHAVQPNLSLGEISSTLIPLPDKETRQKFYNVINPIQAKIKSNQTQIRTLTALRDTLLPKLMSGEVRIESQRDETFVAKEPNEPASSVGAEQKENHG